jgi:membrane fusion protein (multidrug efflux system)
VSAGQRVSRGQVLVELDPSVLAAARRGAAAAVTAAEQNAARTQRLVAEGIAPRKDAEQAAAELARVRADLVTAQRQAQLATVRAPIGGVVTRMTATLGATADPAQPLVEIADPSALDIVLNTTPTDAGRIRSGAKVTLSAGQRAAGEPLGIGTVVDVGAVIDSATRSVAVRVRAPTVRRTLRIGETVFGRVAVATRAAALVVPAEALVPEGDGFKVFVVDAHGIAHGQPVTVGARTDSLVEITEGLAAGARVVTYGAYGVQDSAKVVPVEQASRAVESAGPGETPGGARGDAGATGAGTSAGTGPATSAAAKRGAP